MKAPTLILMDVDQHAGFRFRGRCGSFSGSSLAMPPAPNTSKGCAGGAASSVRIVASLVSRFASRPALVCWHAATVDVRQD